MSDPLKYATIEDARAHAAVCDYCKITAAEVKLSVCARCKEQRYCSRECQKKAWGSHKILCNASRVVLLAATANQGTAAFAGGMTVPKDVSADARALNTWRKRHHPVLQWACVNAFEFKFKDHPEKAFDHVCLIQLEADVKQRLRINKTSLVNHTYLFPKYPGVVALFTQKKEYDDIRGKVEGPAVSYDMLVQYGDRWHLQQMMWGKEEFDGLEKRKDWADVLFSITEGKKKFKMVNGNPVRQ